MIVLGDQKHFCPKKTGLSLTGNREKKIVTKKIILLHALKSPSDLRACVCVCAYIHISIHTYTHTRTRTHKHMCMYVCTYIYMYTYTFINTYVQIFSPCMRAHARVCLPCRRPLATRRAQQARALSPRARSRSPTSTLTDRISASTRR